MLRTFERGAHSAMAASIGMHSVRPQHQRRHHPLLKEPSIGLVEAAWLFTRERESVRLVRVACDNKRVRLMIEGPGHRREHLDFADVIACTAHQSEIERRLVSQRFLLEDFADRRHAQTLDA